MSDAGKSSPGYAEFSAFQKQVEASHGERSLNYHIPIATTIIC